METAKLDIATDNERSEEVQHIVERMPVRFGFWVSMIVVLLFILVLVFGWLVRYPDVVTGQIIINANNAPIKLISNTSGKLKLGAIRSMSNIREGDIIAYLENPTSPGTVFYIDSLIKTFNPNSDTILSLHKKLPKHLSIGELNTQYYDFVSALQLLNNYKEDKLYDNQEQGLKEILTEQILAVSSAKKRVEISRSNLGYTYKFFNRDSTLFSKKVISESELDKTQISYINAKDGYEGAINNLINSKQQARQTQSKLQELGISKLEKEKELRIALIASYNDLIDNIKSWELKYVFKAPFDGKVQFLKFYSENQFVQNSEPVFTVIPQQNRVLGQVNLPAHGSGKIIVGQEVIVKLDDYPYMEYGTVTGKVNAISLTTTTIKTEKSEIETYLVSVDFPNQLRTNYGTKLTFKAEAKGSAEIITKDRRLIQRIFDNLKYIINK